MGGSSWVKNWSAKYGTHARTPMMIRVRLRRGLVNVFSGSFRQLRTIRVEGAVDLG